MKGKRRRHDPGFKARVALESIEGVKTIQEIAKEFDVHPVQVSERKKTMARNAAGPQTQRAGQLQLAFQSGLMLISREYHQLPYS